MPRNNQAEIRAAQEKAARFHEEIAANQRQQSKVTAREKLQENIEKKLLTTGVGALATFEHFLGYLWGQGVPPEELTENQQEFRKVYQLVRDEVFDNVNLQIRGMRSEVGLHTVEYTGNYVNLPISSTRSNGNKK